ncbi:MAG: shikimate kinase [Candidatus Bathyarchaeota archaeon]|nr:shikimate kinase [Candidatus Bathyarchaeota archaeon]
MNIALFGFMGVGKSSVGRLLAERMGLTFVDIDEEIVKRTGMAISSIFEEEGEARFREIERGVTGEIAGLDGRVIACGGGTVLDPNNLAALRSGSMMVLLTAGIETIISRVEDEGGSRPLLEVEDRRRRIEALIRKRHPAYIEAADLIVDTTGEGPEAIAEAIIDHLREVASA